MSSTQGEIDADYIHIDDDQWSIEGFYLGPKKVIMSSGTLGYGQNKKDRPFEPERPSRIRRV